MAIPIPDDVRQLVAAPTTRTCPPGGRMVRRGSFRDSPASLVRGGTSQQHATLGHW